MASRVTFPILSLKEIRLGVPPRFFSPCGKNCSALPSPSSPGSSLERGARCSALLSLLSSEPAAGGHVGVSSAHSLPELAPWVGEGAVGGRCSSGEPGCSSLSFADQSHRGTPACRLCVKFTGGPDGWCSKNFRDCPTRYFSALKILPQDKLRA